MDDGKIRIITVGAAVQDVFLSGNALRAKRDVREHDFIEQFPLGAKIELDDVHFDTGGGAGNAAVTFARQGFYVHFVGKVGHDPAGAEVLRVLRREGVDTDLVTFDTKAHTGYSCLLLAPNGERTILAYRGASHDLQGNDVPVRRLTAEWMYITSLAGNLGLLEKLLKHANTHGIQVALNPGQGELRKAKKLRARLPLVSVLIGNTDELCELFDTTDPEDTVRQAAQTCRFVVMTDGPRGVLASDGNKLYRAGQYQKVRVVDRTGAGDAFGSAFVAAIARGDDVEDAITLASANSSSVVQHVGAKVGILKTQRVRRMKIKVEAL